MRPHVYILFLIAFSFLLFARADGQVAQDPENQPGISLFPAYIGMQLTEHRY